MTRASVGLVLLAAGSSRRMGAVDKVWAPLGGSPVIVWSLRALHPHCDETVVVVRNEEVQRAMDALSGSYPDVRVVAGGAERQQSVARGIECLRDVDVICVHDSARPFATAALLDRGVSRLDGYDGAIPVIPIADTVKRVLGSGVVAETLDRSELRAVQTPQVFRAEALRRAHVHAGDRGLSATDDSTLLEACGMRVTTFEGLPENLKITTEIDLHIAQIRAAGVGT